MIKKERLNSLIKHFSGGKPSLFAKFIGVAPSTVSSWIARDTLDYDLLFAKCENISARWLITGEGEMLKSETNECLSYPVATQAESSQESIPLIPLGAMAGFAVGDGSSVMEYECEHYIIPAFRSADFLIRISGDSMTPKYQSGDIVACKKISLTDIFFQWGKVYVLDTDQGPIMKMIKKSKESSYLTCVSENHNYEPFEISITSIYSIALVVGIVRTE